MFQSTFELNELNLLDSAAKFKNKNWVLSISRLILRFFLQSYGVEIVAASSYVLNNCSCYCFRALECLKLLRSSSMQASEHCAFMT